MSGDWKLRILLGLLALTVFISIGQRDLFVGDETKYGQVIREMRATDSFLVPMLNGRPYSHKPPLHFWIIYLLTLVFGVSSSWPFFLPAAIAFVLLLFAVARIGREMFDRETGLVAPFVFGTFYLAWGLGQTARMDLEYLALIVVATLYVFRFLRDGGTRNLTLAGVAIGVAILFKGPMALVMVILTIAFEAIRRRRFPRGNYLPGFLLAAAIPLAWVIPAVVSGGRAYAEELLIKQNVGRAVGSWVHREPPWYYIAHFPGTFFPWFLIALVALVAIYRRVQTERDSNALRFCVSWILSVVVPFSLISGKLDVYMLPAMVPFALIIARFLRDDREDRLARVAWLGNVVILCILAVVAIAVPIAAPHFAAKTPDAALAQQPLVQGLFWTLLIACLIALVAQFRLGTRRLAAASFAYAAAAIAPLVYAACFLIPLANELGSTRPLTETLRKYPDSGEQIALYASPFLWNRDLPESLQTVEYIGRRRLEEPRPPNLVVSSRAHAHELGPELARSYQKVDEFRMIGKPFDVYRRR